MHIAHGLVKGAVCAYCGSCGGMLQCVRCKTSLCYGGTFDCVQDAGGPISSETFLCPVCRRKAREVLDVCTSTTTQRYPRLLTECTQYKVNTYVIPATHFAAEAKPLCLVTAHWSADSYSTLR